MRESELQRVAAVEIPAREARLHKAKPVSRNAFVRELFDGLYMLSRRSLFLSSLKMEEVMVLGRERCVLQAGRVAERYDAICAGTVESLRFILTHSALLICSFMILWFVLTLVLGYGQERDALLLSALTAGSCAAASLLASLRLRRHWLRLRRELESSGLLERFALGDEELLAIHRYALKPFGWLALGWPRRNPRHILGLLMSNLDWYLGTARPLLRLSWLSMPLLLALLLSALSAMSQYPYLFATTVPLLLVLVLPVFIIAQLWFDWQRSRMNAAALLLYLAARLVDD